jgi:hypothetical protein
MNCFECGGKLDTTKPYRHMDVFHEKDNPDKMPIYANEECIVGSPNEPNWRHASRVNPNESEIQS